MSKDPEVQRLAHTTAYAYAKAELLANELEQTVTTLQAFIREKPPVFESYPRKEKTE